MAVWLEVFHPPSCHTGAMESELLSPGAAASEPAGSSGIASGKVPL